MIGLLFLCGVTHAEPKNLALYDVTLQEFVEWTSTQLGRSVVVGSDIRNAPISVFASYSNDEELERLLEDAVISSGFHFSAVGSTLRISSEPLIDKSVLVTEVIQLQNLQSDFAYNSVRDVLFSHRDTDGKRIDSGEIMVSASPTTNAIIITAPAETIEIVRSVVAEIDKPRQQVVITAVVAELADDDFEALGLNLGASSNRFELSGSTLRSSDMSDLGFSLTFSGPTLRAFLNAVKSTGNNKILSTPQLLTLNREAASIVVGQNIPLITGKTTSGSTPASDPFQTIVREDVGVTLNVTPFITPSNSIELLVQQSASSVSTDKTAADIITNTRRISTRIQLKDGYGVVLGGLRSEQLDESHSRIPFLSDLPWIGNLFTSRSTRSKATNLVVLITARIHGDEDAFTAPYKKLELPVLGISSEGIDAVGDLARNALNDVPVTRH